MIAILLAVIGFDSTIIPGVIANSRVTVEHNQYHHELSGNRTQSFLNDGTYYTTHLRLNSSAVGASGERLSIQGNLRMSDDTRVEPIHRKEPHLLSGLIAYERPDRYSVALGDVVASLSRYSLGRSVEGLSVDGKVKLGPISRVTVVGGRTARAITGSAFDRFAGGARVAGDWTGLVWGMSGAATYDDPSRTDRTLTRAVNGVAAADWSWEREEMGPFAYLAWEGEIARSWDKSGPAFGARRHEDGDAARSDFRLKWHRIDLGLSLERVERFFASTSGSASADQELLRPTVRYVHSPRLFMQFGYTGVRDNLDHSRVTTMNRAGDAVISARPSFAMLVEIPLTYNIRHGDVERGDRTTDQTSTTQNLSAVVSWRGVRFSARGGHARLSDAFTPRNENIRRSLGLDASRSFAYAGWTIAPSVGVGFDRTRQTLLDITRTGNASLDLRFREEFSLSCRARYQDADRTSGGRSEAVTKGVSAVATYHPSRLPGLRISTEYSGDRYNYDIDTRDYGEEKLQGRVEWSF